jgi:hypothetical protein
LIWAGLGDLWHLQFPKQVKMKRYCVDTQKRG